MGPITIQDKIIDGIGQMETPQWRGSYTGGIWQDVFLSYTGQTHINDVFITGNFKNGDIEIINEINNGIGDGIYKLIFDINKKQRFEELFTLENTNLKVIKRLKILLKTTKYGHQKVLIFMNLKLNYKKQIFLKIYCYFELDRY